MKTLIIRLVLIAKFIYVKILFDIKQFSIKHLFKERILTDRNVYKEIYKSVLGRKFMIRFVCSFLYNVFNVNILKWLRLYR